MTSTTVVLAATWRPRGEGGRWREVWPRLEALYERILIVAPHDADLEQVRHLQAHPGAQVAVAPRPSCQRHEVLRLASASGATHVHCADRARLLHRAATRPGERRAAAATAARREYSLLDRSAQALATHPRALRETAALLNAVGAYLLGQPVDRGGGSRGFSRAAARAVVRHAVPAGCGDAAWPLLAQRAGFRVDHLAVDGLDRETPDPHQERVADPARQRRLAEAHDRDPERWARRTQLALQIVQEALAAARPLSDDRLTATAVGASPSSA
jgi:hypothetical protein